MFSDSEIEDSFLGKSYDDEWLESFEREFEGVYDWCSGFVVLFLGFDFFEFNDLFDIVKNVEMILFSKLWKLYI